MIAELTNNETILLKRSYEYKDYIKQELQGARWKKDVIAWEIPFTIDNVRKLQAIRCDMDHNIIEKYNKKTTDIREVTNEKLAMESVEIEPMPITLKPYQHQIKGFNIACKLMNLFIKEE